MMKCLCYYKYLYIYLIIENEFINFKYVWMKLILEYKGNVI